MTTGKHGAVQPLSAADGEGDGAMDFSTILASMVHDMKNSLGMLLGTLDDVTSRCKPEGCGVYDEFSKLQYEAKRLNNDLIQLLTLYKIDTAQYTPNIVDFPVADFIEENILQNRPLMEFKGIEPQTDVAHDLVWFFDRDLLAGVFNNVVNNVLRYTRDALRVSAREEDGYLVIDIDDNGRGYPEDMLRGRLQPRHAVSFRTGSTGLGLYFASLVAELHRNGERHGTIALSNGGALGGGRFSIYLP